MGSEYKEVPAKGMAAYRAPSLFQPHKARQALRDAHNGKISPLIGFYCGVSTVPTASVVAQLGADIVWIDWEHSSCGVETMTTMVHVIQFMSEGKSMPFVRIPGHDHSAIGFALDAGASIIVPQVETVEQAQHLVSSAKFGVAHKGTRSAPPCRWLMGLSDTNSPIDPTRSVFENVNDQAAIIIQMESELAINNLDVILTAVGDQIDAVWIGGLDLRVSMGLDGFWGSEPEFLKVIKQYEETLKKHDMPNSGGGFGRNWSLCANKAFAVVSGDVVTLMGETATITDARQVFGPLKKGQETNVRDVLNGTPL